MSNIFLITSCINTVLSRVERNHIRSVFTGEERLEQTIETINSIKKYVPDSVCFLLETSKLSETQKQKLNNTEVNIFDFSNDQICNILAHGNLINKGITELYTLYKALNNIMSTNNIITPIRIFKISGRYHLTNKFDINIFKSDEYTFKKFSNQSNTWYSTMLFSAPWDKRQEYLMILYNSIVGLSNKIFIDIESSFAAQLPNANFVDNLNCAGLMSAFGEFVEH
jgi:hypothetical protein